MGIAQRSIDPTHFGDIPRTKEMIKSLPKEIRVCSEHGEEVTISESEFLPNSGDGAPFAKAAYIGCCDAAIGKLMGGILKAQMKT